MKPDNILLEAGTGRALVTDFGIARGAGPLMNQGATGSAALKPLTEEGMVMGTAHFMSPEQAASEPVDGRSDIYALGVVGYLAVSGRLPFEAPNLPALLIRQATEAPPGVLRAAPGLPPALAAAIDRCLARDPAERFPDGEAMAAALAPAAEVRPALPPTLRAWLGARNPLLFPYLAWSAGFGALTVGNLVAWLTGNPGSSAMDVALVAALASSPLFPIVGFHLNHARRQFRAGHTLADLRSAMELARRERAETDAVAREDDEALSHRTLRVGTVASATWFAVTVALLIQGTVHENQIGIAWFLAPLFTTMLLGAVSNALDVQFVPPKVREWWQTGIRDRLWNSRAASINVVKGARSRAPACRRRRSSLIPSSAATLSARGAAALFRRAPSAPASTEPDCASAASTSVSARASAARASSAATVAGSSASCSRYAFGSAA